MILWSGTSCRSVQPTGVGQCTAGGTATSTTGVAMTAGAYHKLSFQVNAAWTSVSFFADGSAIGAPITTNIPTTAGLTPTLFLSKLLGATPSLYYIDQYYLDYRYGR